MEEATAVFIFGILPSGGPVFCLASDVSESN